MADKLVKLGSLVGPTGSQYIQTNSSDAGIKSAASNIIKAYNIRVGDYTISTDTNTIWQCISDTAFSQGPSIKGGTGSTGSTGLQGNGFYVMSEESIEDLIQCLDSNYISVNRDTLVDVLLSEANGGENSQLSQEMSLGLYHHFGGNDYNYYLIDGYLLGNVICEHDGEPVSYVSSYEFVKISSDGSEYTAGTNIDISNSTISAEGYVWNEEKNSFAEGNSSTASGSYSHAEGYGSIASGISSHAEGAKYDNNRNTESAGQASHAEGASTYAKADGSHAEGILNIAGRFLDEIGTAAQELGISGTQQELAAKLLGYGSHVEGMNNKALGSCSHSEGNATKALANSTHAEGDTTIAFGEASHAEGYNTQAKGNQSHAEGSNTIAIGNSAHAEGVSTTASGSFSHAEGSHTEAIGRDSHTEGAYSKANGIASHAEGEYSHAEGEYSHAEGSNTVAQGMASHTEGVSTRAQGYSSHAEGEGTTAQGYSSHAEGVGYSSSVTHKIVIKEFEDDDYLDNVCNYTGIGFNYFTEHNNILLNGAEIYDSRDTDLEQCIGKILESKYVEGYGDTMPSATYLKIDFYTSNAFGSLTDLDGGKSALILKISGSYNDYSHSEGDCTIAEGFASHSEGCSTIANGEASHAEGNSTIAHGEYSHAEGYFNIADGYYSHSEGYYNTSSGDASHTEGSSNIAQGYCSHAEGINTKAKGDYSHAEGSDSIASGEVSHAEGYYATAKGDYSHAEGSCTTAEGMGSHAEGYYTFARGTDSHAEGKETDARGDYSHSEGKGSITHGNCSHAEGLDTIAHGCASHTEGYATITNNLGEHAEGRYNLSTHNESYDEPEYATISSIGIGSSDENRANAVEVMVNGDMYIKGVGGYDGTNPFASNTIQSMINDFANNTAGYINQLPIATSTRLGVIKAGHNLNIGATGVLTAKGYTWDDGSSTMTVNGQINASLGFYETSDIRKKNVIDELPLDKAYELINNCQSIIYTLKDNTDKQQVGLIAQEVQQYFPEVVSEDKDGYLSLDYAKLTAVIFRVLKDIIDRLSKLENK